MRIATLLIEQPWLALVPAAVLGGLWFASRSRVALLAALLWVAYTGWEYTLGHLDSDADIRVDLLVIYPVLVVLTLAALWFGLTGLKKGSR